MMERTWRVTFDSDDFHGTAFIGTEDECRAVMHEMLGRPVIVDMPDGERKVVGYITGVNMKPLP